jgi:beta-glucosidase
VAAWCTRSGPPTVEADFTAGQPVEVVFEYGKRAARGAVRLEWEVPGRPDPVQAAVEAARQADAVVICAGLSNLFEGGSRDRADIDLPAAQQRLIESVAAANPRTIVTLFNGGPLAMPWEPKVAALIEAWYPGQEGGRALARIIFGDVDPSGRLPDTLPRRLQDHAAALNYPGDGKRVVYQEGLFIGYRHFDIADIEPHYPFGFGLGYTTFEVGAPVLAAEKFVIGQSIQVSTTVKNTGSRAGKEVVQLYLRPIDPPVKRPDKELRAFRKITLAPGEEKSVNFTLWPKDFAYYNVGSKKWITAPGEYEILVGRHSRDCRSVKLELS